MHLLSFLAATIPVTTRAATIILSNDDGWAEANVRTLFHTLINAGESVILSAPSQDKSGSGTLGPP